MDNLHSPRRVRDDMRNRGLHFNKALGQNFLTDESILEQIVHAAALEKDDCVLEIGPGAGVLTRELASRAKTVVAVELDRGLIPLLEDNIQEFENVSILCQDILKVNLAELFQQKFGGKSVKVVANLPYYITTPILLKLLEENPGISRMVVMVQKEVAERLTAQAGSRAYGAVSVAVAYRAVASVVCLVPPEAFVPAPKVWSAVLRLDMRTQPAVDVSDETLFFQFVRAGFGQRRKTFVNSLSNAQGVKICKEDVKKVLNNLNIPDNIRAEKLNLVDFAQIFQEFQRLNLVK